MMKRLRCRPTFQVIVAFLTLISLDVRSDLTIGNSEIESLAHLIGYESASRLAESTTATNIAQLAINDPLSHAATEPNVAAVLLAQTSPPENIPKKSDERKEYPVFHAKLDEGRKKLQQKPTLADVSLCASVENVLSGTCLSTSDQSQSLAGSNSPFTAIFAKKHRVSMAKLPEIPRKIFVGIGVDEYKDKEIPSLDNAIADAVAVGATFEKVLGYEVLILKNPTKQEIIRLFNLLSIELTTQDSFALYYAGHGYMLKKTEMSYWLVKDAVTDDPSSWISNSDVNVSLSTLLPRQILLVVDTCYSGKLASEYGAAWHSMSDPMEVLEKRSVIAFTAGDEEEPVADGGRDGHSVFAWHLIQAIQKIRSVESGLAVFQHVRDQVRREFPQTPRYGGILSAGHQVGGDYLFEYRVLEEME